MMTILIVDDNEQNLYQLQVLLGANGYRVVTAANGAEALEKARQTPPSLIITDILMPVMDGFSLCREWMKDERLRKIPLVFYTATYTDERDREFALGLGAERFMVKPEEPAAFIRAIREVIQQAVRGSAVTPAPTTDPPTRMPIEAPEEAQAVYLKQYNEVLIHRLEAKMTQLEQTNRELERSIAERQRSAAALDSLNREVQASRSSALNLMDDAVEARNRLEAANQELRSEIVERKRSAAELAHERDLLQVLMDHVPDHIFFKDAQLRIIRSNRAHAAALGLTRPEESIGKTDFDFFSPERARVYADEERAVVGSRQPMLSRIAQTSDAQGRLHWLSETKVPFLDEAGQVVGLVGISRDISELKRAEEALQRSEALLVQAGQMAHLGAWEIEFINHENINANPLRWSEEVFRIFGYQPGEVIPTRELFYARVHPDDRSRITETIQLALTARRSYQLEHRIVRPDGSERVILEDARITFDAAGLPLRIIGAVQDITERKRAERERDTTMQFLRLVNECAGTVDLIHQTTAFFQQQSGCHAVGVRLRKGDDYPYFETRGFPSEFVQAENQLCLRDDAGAILRDGEGNPVIECMCGNIIRGRFDPAKTFFTAHGSFWTNCTTELLAGTTEADRQARTRNRCNGEGYESVALLPLRLGGQGLGLLQMNDRRKGVFSLEMIGQWERLADHLAVALAKFGAEEALRESEEHYRSLFENMLNGYAYCRMHFEEGQPRDFTYLDVNGAFQALTGLKNVVGKKVSEVIPGIRESDPALFEVYGRVAWTGAPERFENYIEALRMWFSISVYSPQKEYFVAVFDVITDRKRAEEEILKLNRELEQRVVERTAQLETANRELEAFSYSVSHDLRAPLRAVNGFARILVEDHADHLNEEGLRVLDTIRNEARRMDQLIDDMLAFARASRRAMRMEEIDMTALAREVLKECAVQAQGRELRLQVRLVPPAQGDPAMVRQVLANLISNAIKYTRPKPFTEIEIGVMEGGDRREGSDKLDESATRSPSTVTYFVRDNGVGFDMKYGDKLFGIFQRLHTEDEFEGTGVGLALVQRIVHRHGGRVWAEGKVNEGATFYFTLPPGKATA